MMKISNQKKEKISEQILLFLFSSSPKPLFTSHIANEIARDEEFVKSILNGLSKKGLISQIKKNSDGKEYIRRSRWKLSQQAYDIYKKRQ